MFSSLIVRASRSLALIALAAVVVLAAALAASRPSLQSVRLTAVEGSTSVVLTADGPLPLPQAGILTSPPRIYFDFLDVGTETKGVRVEGNVLVRGVRIAIHQPEPLVTRVVIDLSQPAPCRIDSGLRESGQLTIVVGTPTAPPAGRVPPIPPTPRPDTTVRRATPPMTAGPPPAVARASAPTEVPPATSPAPVTPPPQRDAVTPSAPFQPPPESARPTAAPAVQEPAGEVAPYMQRVGSLLTRLERLRPLLVALDTFVAVPGEPLKGAAAEFASIKLGLADIAPPTPLAAAHELLRDVCSLGVAAVAARIEPGAPDDAARAWNAASGALGAILLLDQARAALGLEPVWTPTAGGTEAARWGPRKTWPSR
jgi:hypothetical protein